eukprot:gene6375-7639_t
MVLHWNTDFCTNCFIWLELPHSYSVISQHLLLEFLNRDDIQLSFSDLPFYNPAWKRVRGLFPPADEAALLNLKPSTIPPEGILRIAYPFVLQRPAESSAKVVVYGTTEWTVCQANDAFPSPAGISGRAQWEATDVTILTASEYSRGGFLRCGVPRERVTVIPNGVDLQIFQPAGTEARATFRKRQEWEGRFVFLNVGAMTTNKGVVDLIRAFLGIQQRHPRALLFLKGGDHLYPSLQLLVEACANQGIDLGALLQSGNVEYAADPLAFRQMAELYRAADVYVTPYRAEGFNMPVLEAAACGLAVICTRGGPTDEFTAPSFALHVNATLEPVGNPQDTTPGGRKQWLRPDLLHLQEQMEFVMTDEGETFLEKARQAGPAFIKSTHSWTVIADRIAQLFIGNAGQDSGDVKPDVTMNGSEVYGFWGQQGGNESIPEKGLSRQTASHAEL